VADFGLLEDFLGSRDGVFGQADESGGVAFMLG
jgi:hypothetical protein